MPLLALYSASLSAFALGYDEPVFCCHLSFAQKVVHSQLSLLVLILLTVVLFAAISCSVVLSNSSSPQM